jgi:hypothetical protein
MPNNNSRRTRAATTVQRAFRKARPEAWTKAKLRAKGGLTNTDLNKLAKIVYKNGSVGGLSAANMAFFMKMFPNKTNEYYLQRKAYFTQYLRDRYMTESGKIIAKLMSNAYKNYWTQAVKREQQQAMNNLTHMTTHTKTGKTNIAEALRGQRLTGQSKNNIINVAYLGQRSLPIVLSPEHTKERLLQFMNMKTINQPNFQNALKFFKNYRRNKAVGNIKEAPEPPSRNGMSLKDYTNAKRQYESNIRNWMKQMAIIWYRHKNQGR